MLGSWPPTPAHLPHIYAVTLALLLPLSLLLLTLLRACVRGHALRLQATYDKLLTEVPKYKMISTSVLADRLRVSWRCLCPAVRARVVLLFFFVCCCTTAVWRSRG